jgi:hypothetical protein
MVKATPENVFVGSVLVKKKERYNVYKVNQTFIWAGKHSTNMVLRELEFKAKGITFANIMEQVGAKKLNYNNLMLDETDIDNVIKKKNPTSKKEIKQKGKYVDSCCVKELDKLFKKAHAKKTYQYPLECACGKIIFAIKAYDNVKMAFRREYTQLMFNFDTKEISLIKEIGKAS